MSLILESAIIFTTYQQISFGGINFKSLSTNLQVGVYSFKKPTRYSSYSNK